MTTLGKYELLEKIGEGAFADVYRAIDTMLKRTVALKVLKPALLADNDAFNRFVQEAQVAAGLFHPHIATVLDLGQAEGRYFIAMRYVDGPSLDKVIAKRGSLPWGEALRIASQVAEALAYAHGRGLVHRDVKPQNILVSPDEGAVLTDFGLVRALEASGMATRSGAILGTPQYIPPEVWRGQPATPAADQYALACVFTEMLSGRVLYDGPTPWAVMQKHSQLPQFPASWPPGTPPGLANVLAQALAHDPAQRYPSCVAFMGAIIQRTAPARGEVPHQEPEAPLAQRPGEARPTSPLGQNTAAHVARLNAQPAPEIPMRAQPIPLPKIMQSQTPPQPPPEDEQTARYYRWLRVALWVVSIILWLGALISLGTFILNLGYEGENEDTIFAQCFITLLVLINGLFTFITAIKSDLHIADDHAYKTVKNIAWILTTTAGVGYILQILIGLASGELYTPSWLYLFNTALLLISAIFALKVERLLSKENNRRPEPWR